MRSFKGRGEIGMDELVKSEWLVEFEKFREESQKTLLNKLSGLIKPKRLAQWKIFCEEKETVNIHFLFWAVTNTMEIVEALVDGRPMKQVLKIFKNQQNGLIGSQTIRNIVLRYSKRRGMTFYFWSKFTA